MHTRHLLSYHPSLFVSVLLLVSAMSSRTVAECQWIPKHRDVGFFSDLVATSLHCCHRTNEPQWKTPAPNQHLPSRFQQHWPRHSPLHGHKLTHDELIAIAGTCIRAVPRKKRLIFLVAFRPFCCDGDHNSYTAWSGTRTRKHAPRPTHTHRNKQWMRPSRSLPVMPEETETYTAAEQRRGGRWLSDVSRVRASRDADTEPRNVPIAKPPEVSIGPEWADHSAQKPDNITC